MDRFTIIATYYLWLKDHYDGQWSKEYRRMCKIGTYYTPSQSMQELLTCGDQDIVDGYNILCERQGCKHEN